MIVAVEAIPDEGALDRDLTGEGPIARTVARIDTLKSVESSSAGVIHEVDFKRSDSEIGDDVRVAKLLGGGGRMVDHDIRGGDNRDEVGELGSGGSCRSRHQAPEYHHQRGQEPERTSTRA
jgi:hypothetical protein